MSLSGGQTCMKYSLFVINLLFCILGAVLLGVGIWVRFDSSSLEDALQLVNEKVPSNETIEAPPALLQSAIVLIVAGAFVFIVSFLGCCGAIKEWRILLILYAIIISLLSIMDLAGAIAIAVYRGEVIDTIPEAMNTTLVNNYFGVPQTNLTLIDLTAAWDIMQKELKCCGVDNHSNFKAWAKNWVNITDPAVMVPPSCCIPDKTGCPATPIADNAYINNGCVDDLQKFVDKYAWVLFGIALTLALLQLLGVIFACVLCHAIGKSQNSV